MQSHYFIRRFFQVFLSFTLLFCITAVAQKAYALQAVVTRNIFYAPVEKDGLKPYLEVYWQVDPRTVAFKQSGGKWQAAIRTDIIIRTDTGIIQEDHYRLTTNEAEDAMTARSQTIIDLKRYMIRQGNFWVNITLTDESRKGNQ